MKILTLDTSGAVAVCSVVTFGENPAGDSLRTLDKPRELSRRLVEMISGALGARWTLDDVDAIAVGLGPGSWTGLRIGVTTAKTLAQARDLPLFGVPTFDAAPRTHHEASGVLLVVAPCRAGEIYVKCWAPREGRDAVRTVLWPEEIVTPQTVAERLLESGAPFVSVAGFVGQNAARDLTALLHERGVACRELEVTSMELAGALAQIAASRWQNGERDDPLALQPLYLAPSNAERNLAAKLARERATA